MMTQPFSLKGYELEGVFRISATQTKVMKLRDQIELEDDMHVRESNPHVIAGCLKLWIRSLKDPIVPYEFYDSCLKVD